MVNTALGGGVELTAFGHTGLETDGDGDIRDGRGKVYKQDGSNVAYTFRLKIYWNTRSRIRSLA